VRVAFVSLLIVGACSGSGNPDGGTSPLTRSAQNPQGASAPGASQSTQATLYWDPVTNPPVDGYRLHYGTQSRAYTAHVDTGNVTSWTVQNLAPDTYYFAVTAVKAGRGESSYSNEVSKTINGGGGANPATGTSPSIQSAQAQQVPAQGQTLPAPAQAQVLQAPAPAQGPGQATLSWNPVTTPSVDGYRVHYGVQSGVYATHLDIGNVTSWTVQNLQPGTYYFAITAIKSGYAESGYSNEVSTTITGGGGG
jgi:hypothetical protein